MLNRAVDFLRKRRVVNQITIRDVDRSVNVTEADAAAKGRKNRVPTILYGARPAPPDAARAALDRHVATACRRAARRGKGMTDDKFLARLFRISQDCAAAQAGATGGVMQGVKRGRKR
jgi:hypothetical protein